MTISIKNIIFLGILSISCGISLFGMEERRPTEAVSLYEYLSVKNDATAQDLDMAYKALEDEEIRSGFKTLDYFFDAVQAYKILSDNELKQVYDQHGYASAYNQLILKGYPQKIDEDVQSRMKKYQYELKNNPKDTVSFQDSTKKVNAYYQAQLFMGTRALCNELRRVIAQNCYDLARFLYGIQLCRHIRAYEVQQGIQICAYIDEGLRFALSDSPLVRELASLRKKITDRAEQSMKKIEDGKGILVIPRKNFYIYESSEIKKRKIKEKDDTKKVARKQKQSKSPRLEKVDDEQKNKAKTSFSDKLKIMGLLENNNKNLAYILENMPPAWTPKMLFEKICEVSERRDNNDDTMNLLQHDPDIVRARFIGGQLLQRAAKKLFEKSQRTPWVYYGLQRAKILCQKALDHISLAQGINEYNDMHTHIQNELAVIQKRLNTWYGQKKAVYDFFNLDIPLDICKDVLIGLINDAETLDDQTRNTVFICVNLLAIRYISDGRYFDALALINNALEKSYAQSTDAFEKCIKLKSSIEDQISRFQRLFNGSSDENFDMSDKFLSEMFADIISIYTRFERNKKFDKMYDLAKKCLTFDRWPQSVREHKLFTTMQSFSAIYEMKKAQGRI